MASTATAPPPPAETGGDSPTARAWRVLREGSASERADEQSILARVGALTDLGLRSHAIKASRWLGQGRIAPALAAEIRDLPDDRLNRDDLLSACERVQRWLVGRTPITPISREELDRTLPTEMFRAADGSRVWSDQGRIGGLAGAADVCDNIGQIVPAEAERLLPPPVLLIGADPPLLLERAFESCAPRSVGYAPRLFVVEPDARAAIIGLADLALRRGDDWVRALIEAERVSWFVGQGAIRGLATWFERHPDRVLPGQVFLTPGSTAAPAFQAAVATVKQALTRQQQLLQTMLQQRDPQRAERIRKTWLGGDPIRALILTTRYANYVVHAARDLAEELRGLGHDAIVAEEHDETSTSTALTYAKLIRDVEPDLVVLINHFRQQSGGSIPPEIPLVTWSQDTPAHYFTGPIRAGALDFVIGHIHAEMHDKMGFPAARTLSWPNAPSPRTFHAGPISPDRRAQLECDIAMATRHSQPPAEFASTLIESFGPGTPAARAGQRVADGVVDALSLAARPWRVLEHELAKLTKSALRQTLGAEPEPQVVAVLLHSMTFPLADLHFRQQTAAWASNIASRRGLRFHLYGRGWDKHPTLAANARPDLAHGDELRAAYQAAGVHLHASVRGRIHQRVAEIAMSGGVPLCRRTSADVRRIRRRLIEYLHAHRQPDGHVIEGRVPFWTVADHPEAMSAITQLQRIGDELGRDPRVGWTAGEFARFNPSEINPDAQIGDEMSVLVDLAETTFDCESELERRVDASLNARWRDAMSHAVRRRCTKRLSMTAFAGRMLDLVRAGVAKN